MNKKPTNKETPEQILAASNQNNATRAAPEARDIIRRSNKCALATLDRKTGTPFVTLAATALRHDCTPLIIVSNIAKHTRNIHKNAHVSLLFESLDMALDPLTKGRVTLSGTMQPVSNALQEATDRQRFALRHPEAFYTEFGDFSVYALETDKAHFVAGFGSTQNIPGSILHNLPDFSQEENWAQRLDTLLATLNLKFTPQINELFPLPMASDIRIQQNDEAEKDDAWVICDFDPEGCDLRSGAFLERINFLQTVISSDQIEAALKESLQTRSIT